MWFFCIFLSSAMRAKEVKEGDRMGHRDDVLMDDRLMNISIIRKEKG